jgi:thiol-disulfide isomerase/thioredoxin
MAGIVKLKIAITVMGKTFKLLVPVLVALAFVAGGCQNNTADHNALIDSLIAKLTVADSISKAQPERRSELTTEVEDYLGTVDLSGIPMVDIERIISTGWVYKNNEMRKVIHPLLVRYSKKKSFDGVKAATMRVLYFPDAVSDSDNPLVQKQWVNEFVTLTKHPMLEDFLLSEEADSYRSSNEIFARLQFLDPAAIKETSLLENMIRVLQLPLVYNVANSAVFVFDLASDPVAGVSADTVELVRELTVSRMRDAEYYLEHDSAGLSMRNRDIYLENLKQRIAYLEGPCARGELIGYPAPQIDFIWSSDGGAKDLNDLKGSVVVIDFWATWCGPCIRSFPNLRKLQERYNDYPVVFLGVTSIQGSHNDFKNQKRYNLKDQPEAEIGYMPSFMKDMEMTWLVAFSKQDVFNPEFGVRGIPHVAILDPAGKVRYNALRPYEAPFHEAEKIDNLLREAGLPFPQTPMDTINYAVN